MLIINQKKIKFQKFPVFLEVIKELKKLECSGSCFEGPFSELGCTMDCKIRQCVLEKGIDGCRDCEEYKSCDLIIKHSAFHPGLINNLKMIKEKGIEDWLDDRGEHYKW